MPISAIFTYIVAAWLSLAALWYNVTLCLFYATFKHFQLFCGSLVCTEYQGAPCKVATGSLTQIRFIEILSYTI